MLWLKLFKFINVLGELIDVVIKLLSIFKKSWQSVNSQITKEKGISSSFFKRVTLGNYQPGSLNSVPAKIMNRFSWETC